MHMGVKFAEFVGNPLSDRYGTDEGDPIMTDDRDLSGEEAVKQIRSIANNQTGMLCTFPGTVAMDCRPMATQAIDDDGTFWFLSSGSSSQNEQIAENSTVHLVYAVPGKSEFLSLEGLATVSRDQKKIDELWTKLAVNWFPGGKDDPDLTLISVMPVRGRYWDTRSNRAVQMVKIAIGAVTGIGMNVGVAGSLDV
jgi:general stress protein 26